jgi:ankyrin repeat protein
MLAKADALSELLRRGAQIDAQDASGQTALMHAVLQADYDKVKLLIDHGADISLCDDNGETALAHAMSYGLLGIQEWLMAQSS